MSLDTNLFTLNVTPNQNDRNVTDLVDPSGIIHYRKQRVPGPTYKSELYGMHMVHYEFRRQSSYACSQTLCLDRY